MTNGLDFGLTQILFTTKVFFLTVIPAQAGIQTYPFGNRRRKKFFIPTFWIPACVGITAEKLKIRRLVRPNSLFCNSPAQKPRPKAGFAYACISGKKQAGIWLGYR